MPNELGSWPSSSTPAMPTSSTGYDFVERFGLERVAHPARPEPRTEQLPPIRLAIRGQCEGHIT